LKEERGKMDAKARLSSRPDWPDCQTKSVHSKERGSQSDHSPAMATIFGPPRTFTELQDLQDLQARRRPYAARGHYPAAGIAR
jgi:hypothetical protein